MKDFKTELSQNIFGFLSYVSRSGSTLLSRKLNEHKEICVTLEAILPGELFGINNYHVPIFRDKDQLKQYVKIIFGNSRIGSWGITKNEIIGSCNIVGYPLLGQQLLKILLSLYKRKYKPNCSVIIYKGPPAMSWVSDSIMEKYSDFKLLNIVRDPRAVYNSQKNSKRPYHKGNFTNSVIKTTKIWKDGIKAVGRVEQARKLDLRFEDLVSNEKETKEKVLQFFNIGDQNFESDYNLFEEMPDKERDIHSLVNKKTDQNRIAAWKDELRESEIRFIEIYLSKFMKIKKYNKSYEFSPLYYLYCMTLEGIYILKRNVKRIIKTLWSLLILDEQYLQKIRSLIKR